MCPEVHSPSRPGRFGMIGIGRSRRGTGARPFRQPARWRPRFRGPRPAIGRGMRWRTRRSLEPIRVFPSRFPIRSSRSPAAAARPVQPVPIAHRAGAGSRPAAGRGRSAVGGGRAAVLRGRNRGAGNEEGGTGRPATAWGKATTRTGPPGFHLPHFPLLLRPVPFLGKAASLC